MRQLNHTKDLNLPTHSSNFVSPGSQAPKLWKISIFLVSTMVHETTFQKQLSARQDGLERERENSH
jgi:hypothetical protein